MRSARIKTAHTHNRRLRLCHSSKSTCAGFYSSISSQTRFPKGLKEFFFFCLCGSVSVSVFFSVMMKAQTSLQQRSKKRLIFRLTDGHCERSCLPPVELISLVFWIKERTSQWLSGSTTKQEGQKKRLSMFNAPLTFPLSGCFWLFWKDETTKGSLLKKLIFYLNIFYSSLILQLHEMRIVWKFWVDLSPSKSLHWT